MNYELLYIIPATKTDDEVAKVKGEVSALISSHATAVLRDEQLGKLKLAYPIQRVRYGHYVLVCFTGDMDTVSKIERELNHLQDVIRFMTTRMVDGGDTKKVTLVEYTMPDVYKKRSAKSGVKKSGPAITVESAEKAVVSSVKEAEAAPVTAPTMTESQLDEHLDRILDGNV